MAILELNKIYNEDCLKGMKKIDDNSVDLIVTDPPYCASEVQLTIKKVGGGDYKTIEESWDKNFNPKDYFHEMYRISKQQLIFCSHHQLEIWLSLAKKTKHFRQIVHYIKTNPMPSTRKFYKFSVQYIIWIAKPNYEFNRGNTDIFYYSAGHTNINHPSVKNIDVISKLILNHTKKDDIVLDPFIGSGTTAVACKMFNRRFIGFELNKEYCEIANKRSNTTILNQIANDKNKLDRW